MFNEILSKLNIFAAPANDIIETRREPRHDGMQVQVVIGGRAYEVYDWSRSGVAFETPDADWNIGGVFYDSYDVPRLKAGDRLKLTLRFRLLQGTVEVPVDTHIARVDGNRTVAQLSPLSRGAVRKFDGVIDSFNAQRFMESQIAQGGAA